jgi:MFS family permease
MAAQEQAGEGSGYAGWRVVAASALALAFGPSTIAVLSLGLFMRSMEHEFGWPRTQVAMATTIVSWMIVVTSPLQGWLVDRFGARRVILCSIPAFGVGVAALSLLPPVLWVYYAAWVIIPVLGLGLFPLSYLKIVSGWFERRLGFALGLANSGVAIGSILLPIIVGTLIAHYGWRQAYLGIGLIVLLVTWPVAARFVHGRPAAAATQRSAGIAEGGETFAVAARTRTYLLLAVGYLAVGVTSTALIVHQVPLLVDGGMSPARAALVQTTFGVFGLLGRLVSGLLLDRFRASRVMITFVLGGMVACALYALGAGGNVAFVCSALIGLLFGTEFDVLAFVVKHHFGMRSFGKLYGVAFAMFQFGAGFGAALLPIARDRSGSYSAPLWLFAALLLVSAGLFAAIRDVAPARRAA